MVNEKETSLEETLNLMSLPENQGGDLGARDYAIYFLSGLLLPAVLLIWGWN